MYDNCLTPLGETLAKEKDLHVVKSFAEAHGHQLLDMKKDIAPYCRGNTWMMLYCGAVDAVIEQLEEISELTAIQLKVEKFDW